MAQTTSAAERRRSLQPLRRLFPYIGRYRGLVVGAVVSLTLAAVTTLALPLAVRRMIDHGFSSSDSTFIASYFVMLVVMAAVLAAASAGRYFFVITLGERVVADLRRDVFSHVTTLSPAFFDTTQSGEIVSRLAADATQVKSAVGATASVALRNLILGVGAVAMMVFTSPKLSSLVLVAIPVIVLPLIAFGRSVRRRSRVRASRSRVPPILSSIVCSDSASSRRKVSSMFWCIAQLSPTMLRPTAADAAFRSFRERRSCRAGRGRSRASHSAVTAPRLSASSRLVQ